MKKKNAPIFKINQNVKEKNSVDMYENIVELEEIFDLIIARKNNAALKRIKKGIDNYPDNHMFYVLGTSISLELDKVNEAKIIIDKAIILFPDVAEIHYQLAETYMHMENYENAIEEFQKAIELVGGDNDEGKGSLSHYLNSLGMAYWQIRQKENALEHWKLAIIEDPKNMSALNNYREHKNEYDEPKSINKPMDDTFHFLNIQQEKFFSKEGNNEHCCDNEANRVIGMIMETWNNKVAPEKEKLDSLSPAKKTEWFKSIEIDFDQVPYNEPLSRFEDFDDEDIDYYDNDIDDSIYNAVSREDIILLPFCFPLLKEIGLSSKRIDILFSKEEEPTDYERHITGWAVEVVRCLIDDFFEKKKKLKEKHFSKALEIAKEELEDDEIKIAFKAMQKVIKSFVKK